MSQPNQSERVTNFWSNHTTQLLKGKTISHVEYQTSTEKLSFNWANRAPQIVFTDGSRLLPVADEEMNEAGAIILMSEEKTQIIPSI